MSDPFLGQIMQVGFNFAPVGWLQCAGQSLSISQNSALFALLGTQFGGNGQTTFDLPDFQGRVSVGSGNGAGLSPYVIGQEGGTENVALTVPNLPAHNHTAAFASPPTMNAATGKATLPTPVAGAVLARSVDSDPLTPDAIPAIYLPAGTPTTVALGGLNVAGITVGNTGNNTPVPNLQPYLSVLTIIATQGIFPSRP
jgi:microcystin-dependent protein